MGDFLLGALILLVSTNPPAAVSNYVADHVLPIAALATGSQVDPNDPVEREFRQLLEADEAAEQEIERLVADVPAPDPTRTPLPAAQREAIRQQLLKVINTQRERYEDFIRKHPRHVGARLAYGDHLSEHGEDHEVIEQLGVALELDPRNAVVWNNYAGYFGHVGPITNAFAAYERARELRPYEPLYHYNLGTVVFLYRVDAQEYYHCDETAVFERALELYREARRLAPRSFRYAFDYAQTFYGVKPVPATTPEGRQAASDELVERALRAWEEALAIANNDTDREGIYLHFARWQIKGRRWDQARASLARATRPEHQAMKERLERSLTFREVEAANPPEVGTEFKLPKPGLLPQP